jgi:hypothetical protein
MWSKIKAMPGWSKFLIVFVALSVIYGLARDSRPYHSSYSTAEYASGPSSSSESASAAPAYQASDSNRQLISQYQTEYADLSVQTRQCTIEIQQFQSQMAYAAANGMALPDPPICQQNGEAWSVRMAFLETEVYKLQGGRSTATVSDVSGIPIHSSSPSRSSSSAPADNGGDPVQKWSREGILGHSIYHDETGEDHELPTRPYYYRDRATGELIGSESSESPDNLRDYERMTPR